MEVGVFSKYVKELIIDLDQVDIPGFGIFYAENVPATISDRGTTINPPFRRMYFRKSEVNFDGALPYVQYICAAQEVNEEQAKVETEWCLSRIHSELNGNRSCALPGLGEMKASSDGEYFFIPDEKLDICPDSFGLEPVCVNIAAAPAPAPQPAPAPAPQPEPQPTPQPIPAPAPRKSHALLYIVLILIVLIAATVAFYWLFPVEADNLIESILYTPEELELLGK